MTLRSARDCARSPLFAAVRRRFGYRRLHILLRREGLQLNHKKLRRLYAEERLQVRRRGGRERALGTRAPLALPHRPNQRWSLDFVHDQLSDGRRFRILAVVDDFTREFLALVADTVFVGKERRFNRRFLAMCSHYLVEPTVCTPAAGWEKGQVENQVGNAREHLFTPRLHFVDYAELNAWLEARCLAQAQCPSPSRATRRELSDNMGDGVAMFGADLKLETSNNRRCFGGRKGGLLG